MKTDSEQTKAKLSDEKVRLTKEFEEMKYSGEAKTSVYEQNQDFLCMKSLSISSSGQRTLDEAQEKLNESERRRDESSIKMEKTMKKMIEVKSGIEHLADKLHHLKGVCIRERSLRRFL